MTRRQQFALVVPRFPAEVDPSVVQPPAGNEQAKVDHGLSLADGADLGGGRGLVGRAADEGDDAERGGNHGAQTNRAVTFSRVVLVVGVVTLPK